MATFNINASTNFDQLVGAQGDDTYNINSGSVLTIDTDTRYCLNHSAALTSALGNITINASQGGTLFVDGTKVRYFSYTGGTGNVPAPNTTISQAGVSASLLTVQSALNVAPTLSGSAMPATGFIKVKNISTGSFTSGTALTGIAATASSVDKTGWIEVHAVETRTLTVPRLGLFATSGSWFDVGVTTGVSSSTYQLPCTTSASYWSGIWVETTASSDAYEFYPCVGGATTTSQSSSIGKICYISSAGLLRLGSNNGTTANGYLPTTGSKIRVPNINFQNVMAVANLANTAPSASLANRYEFATTGGGVTSLDKCNMAWYLNLSQSFSFKANSTSINDNLTISELATPISCTDMHIGITAGSASTVTLPFIMTLSYAGGTFTSCSFASYTHNATGNWTTTLTDVYGLTFNSCKFRAGIVRGNATTGMGNWTRVSTTNLYNSKITQGKILFTTCDNIVMSGTVYADACQGTTTTTSPWVGIFDFATNCNSIKIDGLSFPEFNVHPRTALINIGTAGCSNLTFRNFGTYASKLNLGTANPTQNIFNIAAGAAAKNIKLQSVFTQNASVGLWTSDNSSKNITLENVYADYADNVGLANMLDLDVKGLGGIPALTAQTSVYGTHWFDHHTGSTGGRIGILMNEATTRTTDQITLVSGANFTSAGGLYMPVSGAEAYFTMPYYCIGHNGFNNVAPTMAGGTIGNYIIDYDIDTNNGNGFANTWTTASAANMSAITGITSSLGFKLKLRIRTQTANTTAITSLYYNTNSTTSSQAYTYPLDTATPTFTMTGIKSGSEVRIYSSGTINQLSGSESVDGTTSYTYTWSDPPGNIPVTVVIHSLGYQSQRFDVTLTSGSNEIPIQQVLDRQFYNP